jgi:hypothetical protein
MPSTPPLLQVLQHLPNSELTRELAAAFTTAELLGCPVVASRPYDDIVDAVASAPEVSAAYLLEGVTDPVLIDRLVAHDNGRLLRPTALVEIGQSDTIWSSTRLRILGLLLDSEERGVGLVLQAERDLRTLFAALDCVVAREQTDLSCQAFKTHEVHAVAVRQLVRDHANGATSAALRLAVLAKIAYLPRPLHELVDIADISQVTLPHLRAAGAKVTAQCVITLCGRNRPVPLRLSGDDMDWLLGAGTCVDDIVYDALADGRVTVTRSLYSMSARKTHEKVCKLIERQLKRVRPDGYALVNDAICRTIEAIELEWDGDVPVCRFVDDQTWASCLHSGSWALRELAVRNAHGRDLGADRVELIRDAIVQNDLLLALLHVTDDEIAAMLTTELEEIAEFDGAIYVDGLTASQRTLVLPAPLIARLLPALANTDAIRDVCHMLDQSVWTDELIEIVGTYDPHLAAKTAALMHDGSCASLSDELRAVVLWNRQRAAPGTVCSDQELTLLVNYAQAEGRLHAHLKAMVAPDHAPALAAVVAMPDLSGAQRVACVAHAITAQQADADTAMLAVNAMSSWPGTASELVATMVACAMSNV